RMLYDESLEEYGSHEDHELEPSTSSAVHTQGQVGQDNSYDAREGNEDGQHYDLTPEGMVDMHSTHHHPHHLNGEVHHHTMHHHLHEGEGMEEPVEMEEMEEIIDETGQRMLVRADGNVMYHPDDVLVLDDDGSTMTWRIELVDDEGGGGDMSVVPPIHMVHTQQPVAFDVSAYEVCDSLPSSSSRSSIPRPSRVRQTTNYGRRTTAVINNQRFARLDPPPPVPSNPRHSKISRINASKGRSQGKQGATSCDPSPSSSTSRLVPPPAPPPRIPRRPTSKFTTQASLASSTEGLETANCNYCHLRFYMPRTALRSRISYGSNLSQFELPNAFFECPICGMESASGPNSSRS
ncbi:hypothetical protein PFISCL1PPCAC_10771, partial [Pristionchus fissidentatus]